MKKRVFLICVLTVLVAALSVTAASCDIFEKEAVDLSSKDIRITFIGKSEFEYNGLPQTPPIRLINGNDLIEEYYYGENNDNIAVEYTDNVNVGMATVTVTPGKSGKYTGKAVAHFEIVASSAKAEAGDYQSLKEYLDVGGYVQIDMTADITVPEGETLTVGNGVTVVANGHAIVNDGRIDNSGEIRFSEYGEGNRLVNNGRIDNKGKILLYVSEQEAQVFANEGEFFNTGEIYLNGKDGNRLVAENNGSFENDGDLNLNTHADFFNYGDFDNAGYVRASGEAKFYTNSDVPGNTFNGLVRRYPIEEFIIYLSDEAVEYCGSEIRPAINFEKEGYHVDYGDYDATFENNVNVGTATVKIVATKDSKAFFGETTLTFEIKKGKVTVTDREGFYAAIANPNYNEIKLISSYSYGNFFDEGFTVPEGLNLYISAPADEGFRGTVVNNGTISVLNDKGLKVYGTLENNGEIISKHIVNRGTVENNGTITLGDGESYSGNMTNAGEITLDEKGTLYAGGDTDEAKEFVNDGTVTALGTVYVNHKLTNNGTFENNGDLFVFSTGSVSATKAVVNVGNVYLNEESDAFAGGVVTVKQQIQQSDIEIANLQSLVYDGSKKEAYVRIAGGISDKYDVVYKKGVTEIDYLLDAGAYNLTVTFREDSKVFKGSVTVEFFVGRAETSVNSYEALVDALDNYNYYKVTYNSTYLKGDLEVREGYLLVIPEGGSLYNGEYSVVVNGSVENNGEYVNTFASATLTVNDGGSFVNNGSCYFNDVVPEGVSGNGTVYVREDIEQSTILTLTETQVVYCMENGYIKTEPPDFTLTTVEGGGEVDEGDYSSFCTNYYEISTEGDLAKLTVRASMTSTKYYGEVSAEYSVLPGETTVANFEELKTALDNIKDGTELCNFGRITLTADISAGEIKNNLTLTIASNCTLAIGDHNLDLYNEDYLWYDLNIINNGKVTTAGGSFSYVGVMYNNEGGGKIIGYAANADDLERYARACDETYLTADIAEEVSLFTATSSGGAVVIDTCGFDIAKITVKLQGIRSITIKSSVAGSVIGGEQYQDNGIYCEEINKKITLTLVNLTIYGIEFNYLADESDVVIDESCVVIN